MPSNFDSIGLNSHSEDELMGIIRKTLQNTTGHMCDVGLYAQWASGEGAELWHQVDKEHCIIGTTPFFRGKSEFVVRLTNYVTRPDDNEMEGAIHGWGLPDEGGEGPGLFPLVFDLVDFAVYRDLPLPVVSPVRLSAFAKNLTVYDSEEDHLASQDGEHKLASQSFFPTGLMPTDPNYEGPPASMAVILGRILWLCGQIIAPSIPRKQPWWRRMFGGASR